MGGSLGFRRMGSRMAMVGLAGRGQEREGGRLPSLALPSTPRPPPAILTDRSGRTGRGDRPGGMRVYSPGPGQ